MKYKIYIYTFLIFLYSQMNINNENNTYDICDEIKNNIIHLINISKYMDNSLKIQQAKAMRK